MLANTIGYVGEISQQDMEKYPDRFPARVIIGKAGSRKQYNDQESSAPTACGES